MILKNQYKTSYKCDYFENYKDNDYSGEMCYWHNNLNNWFVNFPSNLNGLKFTTNKLVKNQPSTFEYFVEKLAEHTGKKYRRVHIVTNQTHCRHDHYDPDDYEVYCATLLVPEHLAEAFAMSEKRQTSESIKKFVEKHRDVILLASKYITYYTEDYHPEWNGSKKENDAKWKKHINSTKFDDIYREEVRDKLAKDEKSNTIDVLKMLSVNDNNYSYNGDSIIGNLPSKEVAEALFNTIEYAEKLGRLSKLEKIVDNQKRQDDAVQEYNELLKNMWKKNKYKYK